MIGFSFRYALNNKMSETQTTQTVRGFVGKAGRGIAKNNVYHDCSYNRHSHVMVCLLKFNTLKAIIFLFAKSTV